MIARAGLAADPSVVIPDDAVIGAHVVLEAGVVLGAAVTLQHGAVIGKQPALAATSRTRDAAALDRPTLIGDRAVVGCGAVLVAGATLGPGAIAADHSLVREGVVLGAGTVVGHGTVIGARITIGDRSRIQGLCAFGAGSLIEEDVFVGPSVMVTNDPTMGRREDGRALAGAVLRRGCRVGSGAILMPGVEIGEGAVVGAGAVVTRDVPRGMLAMGTPARVVREARAEAGPV